MIIQTHSDQEYKDTLRLLAVINELRDRGPHYHPPRMDDTWAVRTRWARSIYL